MGERKVDLGVSSLRTNVNLKEFLKGRLDWMEYT